MRGISIGAGVCLLVAGCALYGEVGAPTSQGGVASSAVVNMLTFYNDSDAEYTVYFRERATDPLSRAIVTESSNWEPVLGLRAHEKGDTEILVRDRDAFGGQIKIAPACKDSTAPTFFIKGGIKMSGDCVQNWWEGPYSFIIAGDEKSFDNAFKDCKTVRRVRYCALRNAYAGIRIKANGVVFVNQHNVKILDENEIPVIKVEE